MSTETVDDHATRMIGRQRDVIINLQNQVTRMRAALLMIEGWHMPYRGFAMDQGSNGERDYVRAIARDALNGS